jgi:dihydroorotase
VSHEGEAVRDLAIAGGRIAAIGDLSRAAAGETLDCRGPASSTPRCIFAIPA